MSDDALLAGLPRIARVAEEVRLRGLLALAAGAAAAAWWTIQWLLDQPVEAGRTWALALLTTVLAAVSGVINVPRRLREGLRNPRFPSSRMVYETRADGRDRRIRLSGAVFLSTIVILMFDQLAEWGGVTAGVIAGAAAGLGVADLIEARRWARAERQRDADLFVRVGPRALVAGFGRAEVYEVPSPPNEGNAWS
jgi:O-antigen/teichoic acid export membrane protein